MSYRGVHKALLASSDLVAVRKALKHPTPEGVDFHLHVLRTCTVEPIVPYLLLACADWGLHAKVELSPLGDLNSWLASHSEPETEASPPDAIALWWRLEDLAPDLCSKPHQLSLEDRSQLLELLKSLCGEHLSRLAQAGIPCFVHRFHLPLWQDHVSSSVADGLSPLAIVDRLNLWLWDACAAHPHITLVAMDQWLARAGHQHALDPRMDIYGRIPLHASQQGPWAIEWASVLQSLKVPRRKVMAVDADNTLWGGVLGEDGIHAVKVGKDYPGSIYLRIQQRLLDLKATGVLLVLLSKNDENAVMEALAEHKGCLLKAKDFIEIHCNYEDKYKNLQRAAQQLKLGIDSFAFIDDAPFEREQMTAVLPQVLVLNHSSEPLELWESLFHPELNTRHLSEEDKNKHQQYLSEKKRLELEHQTMDRGDFLKSLKLTVTVSELNASLLPRALQMLQKTNQFNLTTLRHGEPQLRAWISDNRHCLRMVHVADRFGDQGWVGLLLALRDGEQLTVDSFLLSCRVLGRQVEDALWSEMLSFAHQHNLRDIAATYRPSPRNSLVAELWNHYGMELIQKNEAEHRFRLQVSSAQVPSSLPFTLQHEP